MPSKTYKAKTIILLNPPVGGGLPSPKLGETIGIREAEIPLSAPDNGLFVQIIYFAVDAYLRLQLGGIIPVNTPLIGFVAGKVLESKSKDWKEGDLFGGNLPFTTYQAVSEADFATLFKLTDVLKEDELSLGMGVLGMPGATAYAALDLMNVNENDRVWISSATGAVGSLAGQIAKNVKKASLVIGSAGSDTKCQAAVKEFGYDACFNYKQAKDANELTALVKKHASEGINFYFENVGGDHFTAALNNLRPKGRIAVCGATSRYNEATFSKDTINLGQITYLQQRVEGFMYIDWLYGKRGNFLHDMSKWHREGLVKSKETVLKGIEKWPEAFHNYFTQGGDKLGKTMVKVSE